jgi:hypothetical protein
LKNIFLICFVFLFSLFAKDENKIVVAEALLPFVQEPEKKRRLQLLLSKYKEVTPRNGKYSEALIALKLDFEDQFFHPSNSID